MRKLVLLGSTGSIGRQTLEVISQLPDWQVTGLAAGSNIELLAEQAVKFGVKTVAVADEERAKELAQRQRDLQVLAGQRGIEELVERVDCDLVAVAIVGAAGVSPTVRAIKAGKDIALSNKETLVAAGPLVMKMAEQQGVRILPVDSEHSAIFQCLNGEKSENLKRIYLTASGGPFRGFSLQEMEQVTLQMALAHPTWQMGGKITIDSATMMNKGLEVIEAVHLFQVGSDRIQVVVHPQSIVHSMVEYVDGSVIAQLGPTDMKIPIQYALTYPERMPAPTEGLDLFSASRLEFLPPDFERFPCLALAYQAIEVGGSLPAVLNAANEVAVEAFLQGMLPFTAIASVVEEVMQSHEVQPLTELEGVLACDAWARSHAHQIVKGWCR